MLFLSLPLRNLGRRLVRSGLTALGVALAVATLIALVGMTHGVERAWTQTLSDRGVHMLGLRKSAVEILSSAIDQEVLEKIGRVEGVKAVAGELIDLVKMDAGLIGVSGFPPGSFLWQSLNLRQGRLPGADDRQEVVMGQKLAERLGLKPGDRFPFLGTELEVVGISKQAIVLNESNLVLPLSLLQKLLGKEGKLTLVNLRLSQPGDEQKVAEIQAKLQALFPDLVFLETKEATEASQFIQLLRKIAWGTSVIALFMGLFFILNTLLMSISERTREIGILSALGWSKGRILTMIVLEGLLLSSSGSLLGLALGWGGLQWLAFLKQLQGFIDPDLSSRFLAEVFLAAAGLGVLGSLYPAWRITRLRAVETLKYE